MKLTAGGTACSTHSTMKDPVRPLPYRTMSGSTMVRGIVWITTCPLSKAWEKNPWGRTFILLISQRKNSNKLTCQERTAFIHSSVAISSEDRRVGKACVSTCRARRSAENKHKQQDEYRIPT